MRTYDDAFYTLEDIQNAEDLSRGILGHDNVVQVLEQMTARNIQRIPWFSLSESDRDIISDYCGIEPRWDP